MNTRKQLFNGLLVGLFFTAPLLAINYLLQSIVGIAFIPFDLFDWIARVLPGDLVTFGIDRMIDVFEIVGVTETDDTAKVAEQYMAVGMVIGIGMVAGAIYFLAGRYFSGLTGARRYAPATVLAAALAIPFVILNLEINVSATAEPIFSVLWIIASFLVWALAIDWTFKALSTFETEPSEPAVEPEAEPEAAPKTVPAQAQPAKRTAVALPGGSMTRRQFLVQIGGATATITLVGAGLGELLRTTEDIQGGDIDVQALREAAPTVEPAPGTRPEYTPLADHYRIDINSGSQGPFLEEEDWRLSITGLVATELSLSLADIRENYESRSEIITMSCISNRIAGRLISTTQWTGVSVRDVLADAGLADNGNWLLVSSEDGFYEYVEVDMIMNDPSIIFAYEWDGVPLPRRHGFPLRIHIPDRYGMKQPKWITDIEVVEDWAQGYWVRRGWSREAIVRTTSVIDTVAVDDLVTQDNGQMLVPVGGIAWAGARGISKVEVRVDGGDWQEARIREPLSGKAWSLWRFDWPFEAGEHTFEVRCVDGEGTPQIEEENGTRPDGATGIHSETANV